MASKYDFDLFVIGAGSGGVRASRMAAKAGARVAIAEEHGFGGTCVIRGCIPKKLFVYASHFGEAFEDCAGFGWTLPERHFDWNKLVANKNKEVARLEGIYRENVEKEGVEAIVDRAEFEDAHTVQLKKRARRGTLHHLRRSVLPREISTPHRHRRRRLYRGRVCAHLPRSWSRGDARLSRTEDPPRFRRRHARCGDAVVGSARHPRGARPRVLQDREARR